MLWQNFYLICWGGIWLLLFIYLIVMGCTAITYLANASLPANDPQKKDYHPLAILLVPFTLPLFLVARTLLFSLAVTLFVLRALLFGLFLALFIPSLIFIRVPEKPLPVLKLFTRIGHPLLKANTYLIKLAFAPWEFQPQPT